MMTRVFIALAALGLPVPALAASGSFFSLNNTNFVVLIAFLIFVGVLLYFKVPPLLAGMLDKRAADIKANLDEARSLREDAQTLLASYERKHQDVKAQADRIVSAARQEAEAAAAKARDDLEQSIKRRLQAAEDQIDSAQAAAVRDVRDRAIQIAVAAAGDVLAGQMDKSRSNALIDESIKTVEAKLH